MELEGGRGGECEGVVGEGVGEGELGGVEFELVSFFSVAVEVVADDGDAKSFGVGRVDTELVGASGDGGEFDTGVLAFDGLFFPVGDPYFSVNLVVDLNGAVVDIETEGEGDGAAVLGGDSFDDGEVGFGGLAFLELDGKVAVGCFGEGEDHEPGGIHVEPVDGWLRNAVGELGEDAVGDGVESFGPTPGDGEQSPGFVNDDKVFVVMKDGHFFGGDFLLSPGGVVGCPCLSLVFSGVLG